VSANVSLITDPNPPARGRNELTATVKDGAGKPVAEAQVTVMFYMAAMPSMGMVAMKTQTTLIDQGNGTYAGSIDLQSGGTWQETITASKDGQTLAVKQSNVSVSGSMAM
jgi:Cu(I)/Ag(I) efflux system membrane fusion protein/cobalt-zinc-cadmium efflux system membrane fusion protein